MSVDDGGPAYPQSLLETRDGGFETSGDVPGSGMSLRDYFAGQVIAQCQITVSRGKPRPDVNEIAAYAERFATTAYIIADAMLAERMK